MAQTDTAQSRVCPHQHASMLIHQTQCALTAHMQNTTPAHKVRVRSNAKHYIYTLQAHTTARGSARGVGITHPQPRTTCARGTLPASSGRRPPSSATPSHPWCPPQRRSTAREVLDADTTVTTSQSHAQDRGQSNLVGNTSAPHADLFGFMDVHHSKFIPSPLTGASEAASPQPRCLSATRCHRCHVAGGS